MKSEIRVAKSTPVTTHRLVDETLQTDNTGVSPDDMELIDHSEPTPEERARSSREADAFRDFLNDPGQAIRCDASFRLFRRGNRLLAVEKVQKGWWACRYFAPRRVRHAKTDERQEPA